MGVHIADHWFKLRRIDDDITLLWEPHVVPLMRCNIWHVRGRDRDLFIDTGMGICSLREAANTLLDKPVTAVATHVHADHIGNTTSSTNASCIPSRLKVCAIRRVTSRWWMAASTATIWRR